MSKKYFWLQLKDDFFEQEEIKLIESMDNGKDYIIFYLKILLKSVENAGYLMFKNLVPYNSKMLSTVTNTNIDIIEKAIKIFESFGLINILDDDTIYLTEVEKMVGSETKWADYKRKQRTPKKLDNVQKKSKACPKMSNECPSILDIDIDKDVNLSPLPSLKQNLKEEREDKKDFLKFLETTREKYKGSGINDFYPTLTFYFDKEIKVASNGYLYFPSSTPDYLSASQAQEVWKYLFKNPEALISISKQGEAS